MRIEEIEKKETPQEYITVPNSEVKFLKPERYEVKLLDIVNMNTHNIIVGYIVHNNRLITATFTEEGKCIKDKYYDLTPYIEPKPWYEDESNFPCVVWHNTEYIHTDKIKELLIVTRYSKSTNKLRDLWNSCINIEDIELATNEEIDALKIIK